jgi:hypothetical protein
MTTQTADSPASTPLFTTRGTPAAPAWDTDWFRNVQAAEDTLDRRICGAKTPTGDPCLILSCHPCGRCRFHGGADLAGHHPANHNADSHGLYARALRPCGPSCPLWEKCPMAGDDVAQLQAPQRPICPYEAHDYQTAVNSFVQMLTPDDDPFYFDKWHAGLYDDHGKLLTNDQDPAKNLPPHLLDLTHRVATVHVMVNRAAAALRETDLIERTTIRAKDYNASYARPHAYLQAYLRLSAECRRYLALLKQCAPQPRDPDTPNLAELLSPLRALDDAENDLQDEAEYNATDADPQEHCTPSYTGPLPPHNNPPEASAPPPMVSRTADPLPIAHPARVNPQRATELSGRAVSPQRCAAPPPPPGPDSPRLRGTTQNRSAPRSPFH